MARYTDFKTLPPCSVAVLPAGDVMVASNGGGQSRVHILEQAFGALQSSRDFNGWVVMGVHHAEGYLVIGNDENELWWAPMEAPSQWNHLGACLGGNMGEPCIHPVSGRMIIPAWNGEKVVLHEARLESGSLKLRQVAEISGSGEWAVKTATLGSRFYLGAGQHQEGKLGDEVPGNIFEITVTGV